jgi:hypothetical protein
MPKGQDYFFLFNMAPVSSSDNCCLFLLISLNIVDLLFLLSFVNLLSAADDLHMELPVCRTIKLAEVNSLPGAVFVKRKLGHKFIEN